MEDGIKQIMRRFDEDSSSLKHADYNYVMSAVMVHLLHCNGARNELTFKTRYSNISALEIVMPNPALGITENFWVGKYPRRKRYNVAPDPMGRGGGYFVVDEKCGKWLGYYGKLREHMFRRVPPKGYSGCQHNNEEVFHTVEWAPSERKLAFYDEALVLETRHSVGHIEFEKDIRARLLLLRDRFTKLNVALLQYYAQEEESEEEMTAQLAQVEQMLNAERAVVEPRAVENGNQAALSPRREHAAADDELDDREDLYESYQPVSSSSEEYDSPEERPINPSAGERGMEPEPEEQAILVAGEQEMEHEPEDLPGVEAGEHELEDVLEEQPEEQPGVEAGEHEQEQEPEQVEPEVEEELPMIADPAKVLDYMRMHNRRACVGADLRFYMSEYEKQLLNLQRGPFLPEQDIIEMKKKMDPADADQVASYEVEYNGKISD
ncbi:hypothetical protein OSTOST_10495 [Ostertagia ostertagi]